MIEARVLDLADRLRAIKEDKVLPSLQQEFYERVRRVPEGDSTRPANRAGRKPP